MYDRDVTEDLDRIVAQVKWDADGLLPVVVQDVESRAVLMMAYMNRESLKRTLAQGQTCFYSRSRQELWLKGETSGHFQDVVDLRLDCDGDCLLVGVRQTGVACHTGQFSCFHRVLGEEADAPALDPVLAPVPQLSVVLSQLAEVIARRKREMPEGAYTTYLFEKGLDKILKKVGEEAAEVIIAAKNCSHAEIVYEVADLFYHVLVLLEESGVSLERVGEELLSRRK
ncbi:MAG: bifunctional phosphoribosyl-AMP cyclohydrolase/phosphoribosyl-ATP diphosphatase HisIE [Peptococcaceae bacterium]|nr:bifunctional phosphoribosyl-AMP cyclohydrolase/phosphoribosyl-ATP diphosphatase HisIE [Peptococcaceae bacterium]